MDSSKLVDLTAIGDANIASSTRSTRNKTGATSVPGCRAQSFSRVVFFHNYDFEISISWRIKSETPFYFL